MKKMGKEDIDVEDIKKNLGKHKFIKRSGLLDESNGWLHNGQLGVRVDITVHTTERQQAPLNEGGATSFTSKDTFNADILKLLDNGTYADATLVLGAECIPAHNSIPSARSSVLPGIFDAQGSEGQSGEVRITDAQAPVMKELLRFMYGGECSDGALQVMAEPLLEAADKYAVDALRLQCEAQLQSTLSVENVLQVLVLADAHGTCDGLKDACLEYVGLHKEAVLVSESWTEMLKSTNTALVGEVAMAVSGVQSSGQKRRREDTSGEGGLTEEIARGLKVGQLRAELDKRGLETAGLKTQLLDRLLAAL